jgi:hypothetical protein
MHRLRNPPIRQTGGSSAASPMRSNETAGPNGSVQFLRFATVAWTAAAWRAGSWRAGA